jgi:hypothetical protein
MTLRFAAARPAALTSSFARTQVVRILAQAANDNDDGGRRDAILRAALKHFSELGLAAASDARDKARTAYYSGKREDYRHWLGICRTLDRRMAVALANNLAKRGTR